MCFQFVKSVPRLSGTPDISGAASATEPAVSGAGAGLLGASGNDG